MSKIESRIAALSMGQNGMTYYLILGEVGGDRKIPIIVKYNEAQYIALKLESMQLSSPMIYDSYKEMCDNMGATLEFVEVHSLMEGIFYTRSVFSNGIDNWEVSMSVGDAVALSTAYKCPIYVAEEIYHNVGISMDDEGNVSEKEQEENRKPRENKISIDDLKSMLERAIENEEYEIASQLRDRINKLEGN